MLLVLPSAISGIRRHHNTGPPRYVKSEIREGKEYRLFVKESQVIMTVITHLLLLQLFERIFTFVFAFDFLHRN